MSQSYTWPAEVNATPTPGGATAANQVIQIGLETSTDASVASINSKTPALGQATMANSSPVVIASNQSDINVIVQNGSVPVRGNGIDGTALTANTLLVSGSDGATQRNLSTDTTGKLNINVSAAALPTGASTSALQTTGNTSLSSIDTKTPALVSGRVPVDGSGVTQPVSAVSLPLPTGASTSVLQTTGNTSLSSIDTKIPSNLTVTSTRLLVDGSGVTQPVSGTVTVNPLTNSSIVKAQLQDNAGTAIMLGQKVSASSLPVVIASDQSTMPVKNPGAYSSQLFTAGAGSTNFDIDCSVGYGTVLMHIKGAGAWGGFGSFYISMDGTNFFAANGCNMGVLDGQVVTSVVVNTETIYAFNTAGVKTLRLSMNVTGNNVTVYAGANRDVSLLNQIFAYTYVRNSGDFDIRNITGTVTASSGRSKVNIVRNDYSSVNVTTAAYVQLIASTSAITNMIEIFDSSGQTLVLATGAAASEVDQFYINPGGNGQVPFRIAAGTRVSIKAVTASATSGYINLSLMS